MTVISTEDLPAEFANKAALADKDVPRTVDYFAATDTEWVDLPDGVQRVEIKVMNEGERRKYLNQTNSEVKMNQRTKDLVMKSSVGDDRHALLKTAIVGWDVLKGGQPFVFSDRNLELALQTWPPAVIDVIEKEVRDLNAWLRGTEDDLDALREEREDLDKRIVELEQKAVKS